VRTPEQLAVCWRDALLARDPVAFGALFALDGLMLDVEHRSADLREARPLQGRTEIEATTRAWLRRTPSFDYEILDLIGDDTRAAKLWRYSVPAVPERLEVEGVTWLACAGGEIRVARVYFDSYRLLAPSPFRPSYDPHPTRGGKE
jgi:hypothetical protein